MRCSDLKELMKASTVAEVKSHKSKSQPKPRMSSWSGGSLTFHPANILDIPSRAAVPGLFNHGRVSKPIVRTGYTLVFHLGLSLV